MILDEYYYSNHLPDFRNRQSIRNRVGIEQLSVCILCISGLS